LQLGVTRHQFTFTQPSERAELILMRNPLMICLDYALLEQL